MFARYSPRMADSRSKLRHGAGRAALFALGLLTAMPVSAQGVPAVQLPIVGATAVSARAPSRVDSSAARVPLLSKGERRTAAFFILAAAAVAPFDKRMANEFERPSMHRSAALADGFAGARALGDPGAFLLAAGTYGVGLLSHHSATADAGLHVTEAIVLSGLMTNAFKPAIGRARPNAVHGTDPHDFRPFHAGGAYRSFPSGHTTAAFAAATAASAELSRSRYAEAHPHGAAAIRATLFGVAGVVGVSRMYHDAHWGTDVVMGAAIGTVVSHALVRRQHSGARGWLDRLL